MTGKKETPRQSVSFSSPLLSVLLPWVLLSLPLILFISFLPFTLLLLNLLYISFSFLLSLFYCSSFCSFIFLLFPHLQPFLLHPRSHSFTFPSLSSSSMSSSLSSFSLLDILASLPLFHPSLPPSHHLFLFHGLPLSLHHSLSNFTFFYPRFSSPPNAPVAFFPCRLSYLFTHASSATLPSLLPYLPPSLPLSFPPFLHLFVSSLPGRY